MVAARRRNYNNDAYPVVTVEHPDAFLFTWTGGDITFASSRNSKGIINKIILDGVEYEGANLDQVLTQSGWLGFHPSENGYHEAYMFSKENSAWNGCHTFYRYDNPIFTLIRYPRKECRSYHTGYTWGLFMFTSNYIKYPDLSGGYILGPIYIPYNLTVNEDAGYYKGKYARVKYKFIEDWEVIDHPDYFYWDFETLNDGDYISIGYFCGDDVQSIILDDQEYAVQGHVSNSDNSKIYIDTAGYHRIYVKFSTIPSNNHFTTKAKTFARIPYNASSIISGGNLGITIDKDGVIATLDPNPCGLRWNVNFVSNADKIYIPEGYRAAYEAANYWKNGKNKFIEKDFDYQVV